MALLAAIAAISVIAGMGAGQPRVAAAVAPVGQGFNLNSSDLRFILRQIKIAEHHAATRTAANPCGTLVGPGPDQIPDVANSRELPWGLRTVDGSCNNIVAGREKFAKANLAFPRLLPKRQRAAENGTTYASAADVTDSQPRTISNLVVDQTAGNPAAVEAAGPNPTITPSGAFHIPNVAPDVGLSAPFNVWFVFFGQFFDHGLDLVSKGGNGTVTMPLKPDDPLFNPGPDNIPNTPDDGPNFMLMSRATQDANGEHENRTNPLVDQSQTYTSHPAHQVFLRHYGANEAGKPVSSGRLLTGPGDGMSTWADVKRQARELLGIELRDTDVFEVPLIATDPYGRFDRGPNGFPQIVKVIGGVETLVEGNPAAPINTDNAVPTHQAFLDDIAHHAAPGGGKTPDADPGTADDHDPNTYDNEMLDAHFMAGDGRVNENIALTSVHHIFHAEHNRLNQHIKDVIVSVQATDPAFVAEWQLSPGVWNGERIFQAARFVTEMEYQHLVFEEFGRKIQPMINLFGDGGVGFHPEINPAVFAEFAHTVYRFGHTMLAESIDRVRPDGTRANIPLLDAFLNPPALTAGGLTADQGVGSVIRGTTRQVGNDIDELVTEAVRNRLLGLPLDLPAINMARGRDTGIPRLNEARRSFFAASQNSAVTPYESWADFSFNLKHPKALANYIAAYGRHPSITGATTLAAKRAAAELIVAANPTVAGTPADSVDFLNSTGAWANGPGGVTITGVDDIDYWVGGLGEKQAIFGGFLGSTMNYVFELQLENLQNGDRFYYLSRTAGLNLLTQLEGNSFAELMMRNSDAAGLPADAFSRPDFVFDLANLGTTGPVPDDPATEQNESAILTRMGNGTIRFGGPQHSVWNGTPGNDRVWSSEGDDTIRGNDGDDWMQGGDGNDNHIGGLGNDTMLDLAGDDTLKGGDGEDVLSSGQGFGGDLNQGGRGSDFIIGGNDTTETFGGPGNDFVFAGDSEDTVFGDDNDDWIEGGGGPFNLLQGDNGAPFADDPNAPGSDVIQGNGGEQDFDAEGGDDIMFLGAGIQRAEGQLGFDWVIHKLDPLPANTDMTFTIAALPAVDNNRDRMDRVEGLSGWRLSDILKGDCSSGDPGAVIERALVPDHVLTAAGIARINGLATILPAGATSFAAGNIILGGGGSDTITGLCGDDILDGDRWLDVEISVRDRLNPDVELRRVDSLGPLRADVTAGLIAPGQLRIVRTLRTEAPGTDVDVAVFRGARAEYDIALNADGSVTVTHARGPRPFLENDHTDTLRNIERLRFADVEIATPAVGDAVAAVTLSRTAMTFPDTTVGTTSAPQTFTVTSSGTAPLNITGVISEEVEGDDPAVALDFGVEGAGTTCTPPITLAPGEVCTVEVTFTPSAIGPRRATIQVASNAAGSPHEVAVSGNGVAGVPLIGAETLQPTVDFNDPGVAEAFQLTAGTTGTLRTLRVFLASDSAATTLVAGLYANSLTGHPGTLLGTGTLTGPVAGAWNNVVLTNSVSVTAGTRYWIAILGPAGGGQLRFLDRCCGGLGQPAETSSQATLTTLPVTWTTGQSFLDGPASAVGLGAAGTTGGGTPPPPPPPPPPAPPVTTVLVGNQTVEPSTDFNPAGMAEAFRYTASASGTVTGLRVFVDGSSTATTLVAALYSDAGGHPGTRLTQGTRTTLTNGALNTVTVPGAAVTAGTVYWIAILGPAGGGELRFRDRCCGGNNGLAETSSQTNLAAMPATWTTGSVFRDGPATAFGIG